MNVVDLASETQVTFIPTEGGSAHVFQYAVSSFYGTETAFQPYADQASIHTGEIEAAADICFLEIQIFQKWFSNAFVSAQVGEGIHDAEGGPCFNDLVVVVEAAILKIVLRASGTGGKTTDRR